MHLIVSGCGGNCDGGGSGVRVWNLFLLVC